MDCTCDPIAVLENIRKYGPRHVVIKESGYVVPLQTARALYDISPDIVLIRKDGLTFGAPLDLSDAARCLYTDCWLGFIVDGSENGKRKNQGNPEFSGVQALSTHIQH